MKRLLLAASLALPLTALAQQFQPGTAVQQTSTRLDATTQVQVVTLSTAQAVFTIPAVAGMYIYIVAFEVDSCCSTAPAASLLATTTTNLNGLRLSGAISAVGGTCDKAQFLPSTPLKSAIPGTAVTITSQAAITSVNYGGYVAYYYAP